MIPNPDPRWGGRGGIQAVYLPLKGQRFSYILVGGGDMAGLYARWGEEGVPTAEPPATEYYEPQDKGRLLLRLKLLLSSGYEGPDPATLNLFKDYERAD